MTFRCSTRHRSFMMSPSEQIVGNCRISDSPILRDVARALLTAGQTNPAARRPSPRIDPKDFMVSADLARSRAELLVVFRISRLLKRGYLGVDFHIGAMFGFSLSIYGSAVQASTRQWLPRGNKAGQYQNLASATTPFSLCSNS